MLEAWNKWDTGHYVGIAVHGYDPESQNPAFFPLYPLLIRWFEPVLPGGALSAALIISHIACIAALATLFRLTEDLHGSVLARRTVLYLMAYPFAFYLVAAYNESLFLALTVGALYCMRRGHWWFAGCLGALASGTRLAGLLLGLAFVFEYGRQRGSLRRVRPDALAIALVPVGTVLYAVFCARAFGDPLRFLSIQETWGRQLSWPWEGMAQAVQHSVEASREGAVFQPIVVLNAIDGLALVVSLVLLVLSIVGPWRLGGDSAYLIVFGIASFLLVLPSPLGMTVPLHGVPRYVLEFIPAFLVLARMGANEYVDRFYTTVAWAVQGVLLIAFFFGLWLS
jgi:Gpi18-like mannosyltransferase